MISWLSLLWACNWGTPEPLVLDVPEHWAGAEIQVTVTTGAPNTPIRFLASSEPIEPCDADPCVDESEGRVWPRRAGPDGTATLITRVPGGTDTLWWQASAVGGRRSEVVVRTIQQGEAPPSPHDGDGDGVPDRWEIERGLDPDDPDVDGDGVTDGEDLWPKVPASLMLHLPVDQVVLDPGGPTPPPALSTKAGALFWQQADTLWAAKIEAYTGALVPPNGRGEQVDTGLVVGSPMSWGTFEGGEWLLYAKGSRRVPEVWRARYDEGNGWRTTQTPVRGLSPVGSKDGHLTFLRTDELSGEHVAFADPGGRNVRSIEARYTEAQLVPPGDFAVVVDGGAHPHQIHRVNLADDSFVAMTTDGQDKRQPRVWAAPEAEGKMVLAAAAGPPGTATEIRVYMELRGEWKPVERVPMPPAYPYVLSFEPFVWNDRSYVVFAAGRSARPGDRAPSQIWLASISDEPVVARRLSEDPLLVRLDPKPYTGGGRPWVFYRQARRDGVTVLRRAETGLMRRGEILRERAQAEPEDE